MERTRIKICGLTGAPDVAAAVAAGVDALGFNCYPKSTRFVTVARLRELIREVPPFVTPVLLFVNATVGEVEAALALAPHAVLQFHGDESAAECEVWARPYLRAVRMALGVDLLDWEQRFSGAQALLADAPVASGYGGGGCAFDWAVLPKPEARRLPLILAGGLHAGNVAAAIRQVRPYAVDVSSGVEQSPGLKCREKIQHFVAAVRAADAQALHE